MIPVLIAVAAFAADYFVETDFEAINRIIKTGIKAVEEENADAIDAIVSPNYHDSFHNTKRDLMAYCRVLLGEKLVEKNIRTDSNMEIKPPKAAANLVVFTMFDKNSYIYKEYKPTMLSEWRLELRKETIPAKGKKTQWLITRAEVVEIDRQKVNWQNIR